MALLLETERLLIRPFRAEDLESFLAYRNDLEVARYQGWSVPYTREQAIEFINEMKVKQAAVQGEWLQLAVELKATGALIGDWAIHIMKSDERQAYLGYTLAREHWGKGYAIEATQRVLAYLFEELHLHRIVAECDVENTASFKLLERVGFRREAHLVENIFFKGAYGSEYHYALPARDWEQLKHA